MTKRIVLATAALLLVAWTGCAPDTTLNTRPLAASSDTKSVGDWFEKLREADGPADLAKLFADDARPSEAELRKMSQYEFQFIGSAQVSGDTATVQVQRTKDDESPKTLTWTLVKDGNSWKLKSAPLE
jgi:hypothetical protein